MYGTQSKRDLALELQAQIPFLRPSIHARRANITVKFQDLYGFTVEGNVDDVNVLNEVREKVREQGRVWWALEASKGANWYLQPQIASISEGIALKSSLKLSSLANAITLKKLIRKGIPPVLRPKVWFSLSGAAKKKSTVPESYYNDLTKAVEGKVTPATKQIDHDLPRTFPGHPWLDTPDGHATLRRVLVGYSFRDSDVGYCQGLNYVAALLLLVMKTEEDAFWMLAVLLENVLVNDCYTNNLSGCHVEQRVFKDLLVKQCPRIASHLEALDFDVSLVATEWFPKGVLGYTIDRTTGKFSVYLEDTCSFSIESYDLKYKPTITGVITKGKISDLSGISVKVLILWLNIVEVTRQGDELMLSVGIASADFPVSSFAERPTCGCGFDCFTATANNLRFTPNVLSSIS